MNGVTVHYTYNGSQGLILDLLECTMQKLGIQMPPDVAIKADIERLIDENGGPNSNLKIHVTAHSQGGLIVGNLAYNLAPEYCKMLHVSTIGSASIISNKRFGSVVNYVSPLDFIPFTDPWGYFKGLFGYGTNLVILKGHIPFADHLIKSDTSQEAMKLIRKRFYDEN